MFKGRRGRHFSAPAFDFLVTKNFRIAPPAGCARQNRLAAL
jgi:hypothetical protein